MNISIKNPESKVEILTVPDSSKANNNEKMMKKIGVVNKSINRVLNFRNYSLYSGYYEKPLYNLYEISQAEDVDGIIKRAIKIKRALLAKEGWRLSGKNNKTVEYVKRRFTEISFNQKMSMNLLVKNIGGDLIRYNNAFLRVYTKKVPSKDLLFPGKTISESKILGYKLIPPETVWIKKDDYGNPEGYMQMMPDGRSKEFKKEEVIHFKMNPRSGLTMAPPAMLVAVDEIRALRRIEENVELLIEQHLFPLLIVSIGTDQFPATTLLDGTSEIDAFESQVSEMPASGALVVSHRHKFELLTPKNTLDVKDYLEHFKKRAYTAVGVSNLDMGEGQGMNRSTADNASKILINDVKDYQNELKEQIEMFIIIPLLLERFNINVIQDEHMVRFEWNDIDIENMIKLQNHAMLKYQMNGTTEDEMRREINLAPLSNQERKKLFANLYSTEPSNGASKQAQSKQQPSNQHGTKLGPESRKSSISNNIYLEREINKILDKVKEVDSDTMLKSIMGKILSLDTPMEILYNYRQIQDKIDNLVKHYYAISNDANINNVKYLAAKQILMIIKQYEVQI